MREPCEEGRARELETGACVPRREVRELATTLGIFGETSSLGCPSSFELVTSEVERGGRTLACMRPPACARGSRSILPRGTCLPERACPPGSILQESGRCAYFVRKGHLVDVAGWLRAAFGEDGGEGGSPFCERVARTPRALAGPLEALVSLTLNFPDNDVTQVIARVQPSASPYATVELERVVAPMIEALRSLGGTAEQGTASIRVRCRIEAEASVRPSPRPSRP